MDNNTMTKNNPITEGVIWKQLLFFFFPIVFGTFFQQLYNTVDTMIVGYFIGKNALACVGGSAAQIVSLIVSFFGGLASGAGVIIAQFHGARKADAVKDSIHTAYTFSFISSIIVGVLGYVLVPWMLRFMNTPEELMYDTVIYLRIYFSSILFVFIFNMGSSILRAVGDAKNPLYYLIICCFINIVLDYIFVAKFHMGVAGAAWATWIAQAISAVLVTLKLILTRNEYRFRFAQMTISRQLLHAQLRIGVPTGLQTSLFCITNIIVQAALNTFGTDIVAAWSVYGRIDALYWMVSSAFGVALTTFVGQNYGAAKYDRIKKSVRICLVMYTIVGGIIVIFMMLFRTPLFYLFTDDVNVIEIGSHMLMTITPYYIFFVFIEVFTGARKGVGDVFIPMILTLVSTCFLRIVWVIVCQYLHLSVDAIIYCYPVTWIVCAIAFIIYYLRVNRSYSK